MSNPNGPVRRRRIAGESTSQAPAEAKRTIVPKPPRKKAAEKPPVAKEPVKKAPAKKAPVKTDKVAAAPSVAKATRPAPKPAPPKAASSATVAEPKEQKARRQLPRVPVMLIPFIVIAIASLVFAGLAGKHGISQIRAEHGIDKAHDKAATAASKAAATVFTYQYNKLDEHNKASKALMTPDYQKQYDSVAPALNDLAPQSQVVVLSQVRSAAPVVCSSDCSADKASILVFLDQARLVGTSKTPTVFGNRIVVDMVRSHGKWLVDNIVAL